MAGVVGCLERPPADNGQPKAGGIIAPHSLYNIGNSGAEKLVSLITLIEAAGGRTAIKVMMPMQAGDVPATYADISAIARDIGFPPTMAISVEI